METSKNNIKKTTDESRSDRFRHLIIKSGTARRNLRMLKDQLIWTKDRPDAPEEVRERREYLKAEIEKQQKIVDELEAEIAEIRKAGRA